MEADPGGVVFDGPSLSLHLNLYLHLRWNVATALPWYQDDENQWYCYWVPHLAPAPKQAAAWGKILASGIAPLPGRDRPRERPGPPQNHALAVGNYLLEAAGPPRRLHFVALGAPLQRLNVSEGGQGGRDEKPAGPLL